MLSLKTIKSAAVIGAGGKMGSGIALVLIKALALEKNKALVSLIDQDEAALIRLKKYLKEQLKKEAERQIINLRELYKDNQSLVENHDIVAFHVESALDAVFFSTSLEDTKNKELIFEAVFEEIDLKVAILKKAAKFSPQGIIFSNTSSIPIHFLEEQAGLKGRIAGFHFYNPPAVQKLVEVISSADLGCFHIGKELGKTCVPSKDVAGFIGNGFFMREILFSLKLLKKMETKLSESILILDLVTKTFLFRPMGIFQLIDYVGIDVAVNVFAIMSHFLDDPTFDAELLKRMLSLGKKGGHQGDSGQKDGFFKYTKGEISHIFDLDLNQYLPIQGELEKCIHALGTPLNTAPSWKTLSKEKDPEKSIRDFYMTFTRGDSLATNLTLKYLDFEKNISFLLVKTEVAKNLHDISTILKLGFFHLFGPDSQFFKELDFSVKDGE